jgi:hypothetical protein
VSLLESRPSQEAVEAVAAQPEPLKVRLRFPATRLGLVQPNWMALLHWATLGLWLEPLTNPPEPGPSADSHCWPVVSCNRWRAADLPGRREELMRTPD